MRSVVYAFSLSFACLAVSSCDFSSAIQSSAPVQSFRIDEKDSPWCLGFSSDAKELLSVYGRLGTNDLQLYRWDLASGRRTDLRIKNPKPWWLGTLPDWPGWPASLSSDSERLAFLGAGNTCFICDTRSGKIAPLSFPDASFPRLSPDAKLLMYPNREGKLALAEVASGKVLGAISGSIIGDSGWSADHQTCVVHDLERPSFDTLAVWSLRQPFRRQGSLKVPVDLSGTFTSGALSPDGRLFVGICHKSARGSSLVWWEIATGKVIMEKKVKALVYQKLRFSANGERLAFTSKETLWVCNAVTGSVITSFTRPGDAFDGPFAFTPNGRTIATSSWDGFVRVWDIEKNLESTGK